MRNNFANIIVTIGMISVTLGAWLIHPSAGFIVFGFAAMIIGIGIVRSDHDS